MKINYIDPIKITFEGLDADNNAVELSALALSLQGASKLLAASTQVALLGRYSKKEIANDVRVYGLPPQAGSYEFWVYAAWTGATLSAPLLPLIDTAVKTAATKATEGITNFALSRWAGRKKEMDAANAVAVKALEEMGHTSRHAMEMVERVALSNHPAVKQLVNPVGLSAHTMQIGQISTGAFKLDSLDKTEINKAASIEIGEERTFTVQITELDLINQTCKVSIVGDDAPRKRIAGQITDPQITVPNNPYSSAFDSHTTLSVKCKPQYLDGELEKLFISDIA